ncbi:hypothetical protein [Bifidobacterium cuniculi]|uniref:Uncharacterized protein n=1 Tax=Bifidobacterium cuniculi TaxID=1688 RepID=A0A087AX03_9BIFI|nr:hypothetical protein [Bifidobacterium cuniculi]KFI63303.1 hypothetical protein BCUN_1271 [Bifidobacterium cuniculi]
MDGEIELYGDDNGILLVGDPQEISEALAALGIEESRGRDMHESAILKSGVKVTQALQAMQDRSGRWVKLTPDTADKIKKHGLMRNNATGNFMGVIGKGGKGGIKGNVQFERLASVANPATVANAQMIMVTMAIQQTMQEMTEYLKAIDAKVDLVLKRQKDALFAKFLAVNDLAREAERELQRTGAISELTWDQIQGASITSNEVFRYAILQLRGVNEDIEHAMVDTRTAKDTLNRVRNDMQEWLTVTADCLRLRDRLDLLKLQRYLSIDMDEEHFATQRELMLENRRDRFKEVTGMTATLRHSVKHVMEGKDDTMRVILLPLDAPAVMRAGNEITDALVRFEHALGQETKAERFNEKQWNQAMGELGQGIADGTQQIAKQTGDALQQAGNAVGNAGKQATDAVGKIANDVGNQIRKGLGGFKLPWQ